jgi:hypothetical protein
VWIEELKMLKTVSIPRCYSSDLSGLQEIQMHAFTDASEECFASVCYFVFVYSNKITVAFVGSKHKVPPRKHVSVPRLEFMGALLGVRLADTIQKEHSLNITRRVFWTDSMTTIQWIKSDHSRYKQVSAKFLILQTWSIGIRLGKKKNKKAEELGFFT